MKIRATLIAAALCLLAGPGIAGIPIEQIPSRGTLPYVRNTDGTFTNESGAPGGVTWLGYQQVTSLSSSASLTVPTGSTCALMVAETQAVRWRPDGSTTAPTASVGMPLSVGTPLTYCGDLATIRFIEQTSSAKLNVFYFK